ncbi:LacI family DNA-binding transcriptional regulator [Limnochorda pilosa]|nr:LacI family DNA-binding transcriptional regulator [Limnochorda pilosa]
MVRLRDIASATGLSINTVSRALNGKPDVSPETRQHVLRTATRLGYRPNVVARNLRRQTSHTLGVVVPDFVNPFFAAVVQGIEAEARQRGYNIVLCNTSEDERLEAEALNILVEQRVAGILLTPVRTDARAVSELCGGPIPVVLIARDCPGLGLAAVLNDDAAGAYLAVEHLCSRGRSRILFVTAPFSNWSSLERYKGYSEALERQGVALVPERVIQVNPTSDAAYTTVKTALEDGVDFDAVFAFSDFVAIGVLRALKEANISVPDDVSVVGYDDIDIAGMLETPLTTVGVAKRRLGQEAARILIDRLADSDAGGAPGRVVLSPQLIVRDSV